MSNEIKEIQTEIKIIALKTLIESIFFFDKGIANSYLQPLIIVKIDVVAVKVEK